MNKIGKEKALDYKLILKYIVVWTVCATVIFLPLVSGRKSLVIMDDGFNQCYPALRYIGKWYEHFIHGDFKMFDFTIGYGDDVIGTLSWYGIGDILLIPFCFASENYLELSYSLSILFRLFLAGLFFLFAVKSELPDCAKILGAVMYSFCPYVFDYAFIFLIFATPMVWLPVIFSGFRDITIKKKMFSQKLFFGVMFLSMCGFYFLYMTIIVFFVLIILEIIFDMIRGYKFSKSISKCSTVFEVSLIGIASSAAVLVPVVLHFLQSPRTAGINVSLAGLMSFGKYINNSGKNGIFAFFSQINNNGISFNQFKLPLIQCLTCISFFFFIHHRKELHRDKMLVVIILNLIALFSDGVAQIMNSFSGIYFRYHFFIFFGFAFMTAELLPEIREKWDLVDTAIALLFVVTNIVMLFNSKAAGNGGVPIVIYIVLSLTLIAEMQLNRRIEIVATIGVIFVALYGYFYNAPYEKCGNGFVGYTYWFHGARDELAAGKLKNIEINSDDKDFERVDIRGKAINASLFYNVPSTYSYYSICNGNVLDFLSNYSVSTAIQGPFIYQGLDERKALESLFCIAYYDNGTEEDQPIKNDFILPMGICISDTISREDISEFSQLEKQMLLTRAIVFDDAVESEKWKSDGYFENEISINEIPCMVDLKGATEKNGDILEVGNSSELMIHFSGIECDDFTELYLVLPDFYANKKTDILVDNKVLRVGVAGEEQYLPNFDRYINITDVASEGGLELQFLSDAIIHYKGAKVLEVRDTKFGGVINDLRKHALQNVKYESNSITGQISNNQDTYMLFSIPYSVGWNAYVDGNKTEVKRVNSGLMAIKLSKGQHNVELKYTTPGLIVGAFSSIFGILLVIFFKRKNRNEACSKNK